MKIRWFFPLLAIFAAFTLSCAPDILQEGGDLFLVVAIDGFIPGTDKSISISATPLSTAVAEARDYSLGMDGRASSYFAGVAPGIVDITITVTENGALIGETTTSAEVYLNQVTKGTVSGVYSGGAVTFTVSWASSAVESAIQVDRLTTFMLYEKEGYAAMGQVNQKALTLAFGSFQALRSVSIRYPDGWTSSFGSRAGENSNGAYIGYSADLIEASRPNYFGKGTYEVVLKDINDVSLMYEKTIDTPIDFGPSPFLSGSGEIYNIWPSYNDSTSFMSTMDNSIFWDVTTPRTGTANFVLLLARADNPGSKVLSSIIPAEGPFSVFIPASTLTWNTKYLIIILGCDRPIDQAAINDMPSYDFGGVLSGLLSSESTKDMQYVHYMLSFFTTMP